MGTSTCNFPVRVSSSCLLSTSHSCSVNAGKEIAASFSNRGFHLTGVRCGSTRRSVIACQVVGDSRESLVGKPSVSTLAHNEKTGLWSCISKTGLACLATTLMANALCGSVWAAVEAAVGTSTTTTTTDENSNFMFLVVCVGEAIALTGAAVGGVLARQRKVELEKINAQLRQINVNLRRQSRVESYAPNLTYAPVGSGRMLDTPVRDDPVREQLVQALKTGKRWLREKIPANAYAEFQLALVLARKLNDPAEEKKAARGIGASCQRQGKYREAINHHMLVLQISKSIGEGSGDTEAYGAIADCYTELRDLETAGKYYDKYIERLESDDAT